VQQVWGHFKPLNKGKNNPRVELQVLAHDPEVGELNMTVTSGPATSGALPKSAEEVCGTRACVTPLNLK
jgi:hypothetical protein